MTTPFTAMRSQAVTFAKAYRADELREVPGSRRAAPFRSRRRRTVRWFRLPSRVTAPGRATRDLRAPGGLDLEPHPPTAAK